MGPVGRWRRLPTIYRFFVLLFGAIDVAVLAVAAAGVGSWFHAGEAVGVSTIFTLFLYGFFGPSRDVPPSQRRLSGIASIFTGFIFLFLSGWSLLGVADESTRGVVVDNVLEVLVFIIGLMSMGALWLWKGLKKWRARQKGKGEMPTFGQA